jgi:hypothetical protein
MNDFPRFLPDSDDRHKAENGVFSMQHCFIQQEANDVLKTSRVTLRALRRLRQSLLNCEICPEIEQCELRENFNAQIDLVIAEINEEWGW